MNITIYQVNLERDEKNAAFLSLESMNRILKSTEIDSKIYDSVFSGEVPCDDLEQVYTMFNRDHPADYLGRSLTVSDVIEVTGDDGKSTFHFCDSIGFKEIAFQPELTQPLKRDTIRVVLVEPGKEARVANIGAGLKGLQSVVGGDIEPIYPFEEEVCIIGNEEGKIIGLPLNRAIRDEPVCEEMSYQELKQFFRAVEEKFAGKHAEGYIVFTEDSFDKPYSEEARTYVVNSNNKAFIPGMGGYSIYGSCLDGSDPCVRLEGYMADEHGGKDGWKIERCYVKKPGPVLDIMAGTFFLCGCSRENFSSLSDEQIKKYLEMYRYPEHFARIGGEIEAVPYVPKDKSRER